MSEALVLPGKQFNKLIKRVDKRQKSNGQNIRFDISKQPVNLRKTGNEERSSRFKEVQCHECEGHGHIRPECPTYLKKQKKGLTASWSDHDNSEEESDDESARHVTALTGIQVTDAESDDDDGRMSYEDLVITYQQLLTSYNEACRVLEKQKKTISQLQIEKTNQSDKLSEAHNEVTQLNAQMDELKKQASQQIPVTDSFEKSSVEVPTIRTNSIGYDYKVLNKLQQNLETKFKSDEEVINPYTGEKMPQHRIQHQDKYRRPNPRQHSKSHSHSHARKPNRRTRSWVSSLW
jgi:hypothetical protein